MLANRRITVAANIAAAGRRTGFRLCVRVAVVVAYAVRHPNIFSAVVTVYSLGFVSLACVFGS